MVDLFSKLVIDKDTTAFFSDETSSGSDSAKSLNIHSVRLEKLNQFLTVCGKKDSTIGQPKKPWQNLSMRSKNYHVSKATSAIVASLEVIAPSDPGHLWEAVQASNSVDKALGIVQPTEKKYLEALAETYQNATSWDTRRQVLAIMADLVSFRQIQQYIPGITEYRFKIARQHILQYGRGAEVPLKKSPRIRVDESQLDQFLSFITSPHVIQDLPFGQRYLHLSDGRILETPNVIRCLIPQRIIDQYTKFCEESQVKPMSPSTISRLLSVCSASVRKSLQGLDYFAADGAKAFDDLAVIVTKLGTYGCGKEWVSFCEGLLKAGKQYLKSDYKVSVC